MKRREDGVFDLPGLVLCEGEADRQFLKRLLDFNQIGASLQVQYPATQGHSGGKSKFGKFLSAASVAESFITHVKKVLVVADNDDDPAASFAEVQEQIESAEFPVPTAPGEFSSMGSAGPVVRVLMVPIGAPGNLETLCLDALYAKWGLRPAVDAFVQAVPAKAWGIGKQSKMRVQSVMAATCEHAPDTSFANHWHEAAQYHLPINHPAFVPIAAQLAEFENWTVV